MSEINDKIIAVASRFLDLHEVKANAMWADPGSKLASERSAELAEAMERGGWRPGWPYCAALCEAVWRLAYDGSGQWKRLDAILTPSVMQSYRNAGTAISREPQPGAIFFMQLGASDRGHAGIVVRSDDANLYTIEGNTSPSASTPAADREGDGVYRKVRKLSYVKSKGLWLRGFLNPA